MRPHYLHIHTPVLQGGGGTLSWIECQLINVGKNDGIRKSSFRNYHRIIHSGKKHKSVLNCEIPHSLSEKNISQSQNIFLEILINYTKKNITLEWTTWQPPSYPSDPSSHQQNVDKEKSWKITSLLSYSSRKPLLEFSMRKHHTISIERYPTK